jgi:DNA-binding transcriptional ArsR family regulator
MSRQTEQILRLLGTPEARAIVVELLGSDGPASVTQLAAATTIPQPSVSRHLQRLADLGVVVQERTSGPYVLRSPELVRRVLEAGAALAAEVLREQAGEEAAFQKKVAKTRLRSTDRRGDAQTSRRPH